MSHPIIDFRQYLGKCVRIKISRGKCASYTYKYKGPRNLVVPPDCEAIEMKIPFLIKYESETLHSIYTNNGYYRIEKIDRFQSGVRFTVDISQRQYYRRHCCCIVKHDITNGEAENNFYTFLSVLFACVASPPIMKKGPESYSIYATYA